MIQPFVTAIMPTKGRQAMAIESVDMFRRQTYRNRELVILDDASDPSFSAGVKSAPGISITYLTHRNRMTIGAKRNLAIKRGLGEIIIHWDSDDLYSSDRIAHQVKCLLDSGAEMAGYNLVPFIRLDDDQWVVYRGHPGYVVGTSMCYWRKTWEARSFPNVQVGEDGAFWAEREAFSCGSAGRVIARLHCDKTASPETRADKLKIYADIDRDHPQWMRVGSREEAIAQSA